MKILSLEAENVKRLKAVSITPDGAAIVIGGNNGNGKSSVLDAIAYALGGKDLVCDEPVRRGEKSAKIRCDLGEFIVTRTFTAAGGGSLKVTMPNGAVMPSPQTVLDKLIGSLTFDPLSFSRMKPREQAETLRKLVGLDTSEIDLQRAKLFEERTAINREIKSIEAQEQALVVDENAPDEMVSVADLVREARAIDDHNEAVKKAKNKLVEAEETLHQARKAFEQAQNYFESCTVAMKAAGDLKPATEIQTAIANAEEENRKARVKAERRKFREALLLKRGVSDDWSKKIDALDRAKAEALKVAAFPVDGLGLSDAGVTMNALPFNQASSAEQLRASVAIGLASNPTLKVLLIRDGSLLDEKSLAMVAELAAAADAQVWIERVGKGAECSVVIEDGAVEGAMEGIMTRVEAENCQ